MKRNTSWPGAMCLGIPVMALASLLTAQGIGASLPLLVLTTLPGMPFPLWLALQEPTGGQSHSRVTSTQPSNKLISHWVEWVYFLLSNRSAQRLTQLEQINSRRCERRKQLVQVAGADWLPSSYLLPLPDWVFRCSLLA